MTKIRFVMSVLILIGIVSLVLWPTGTSTLVPKVNAAPSEVVWLQAVGSRQTEQKTQTPSPTESTTNKKTNNNQRRATGTVATSEGEPGAAALLTSGDSYDDFVSVAQSADGTTYAAYAAYYDGHDQIRLHKRLANGNWSTRTHVPLALPQADIWMPQLAVDAHDRVWVIWSEQTDQIQTKSGNWDLYARALDEKANEWGPLVRLTDDPKPDINPHVITDSQRRIHVVWQAHPQNSGDIQYCRFDGAEWSKPLAVTTGPDSDWYPQVAIDSQGTVWIAFDSYRNGDYDVFLTSIADGKVGKLTPVATSGFYEAHASVACTPDGRVWVAWEQGGFNWGKDQGYWLKQNNRDNGTPLGSPRSVRIAVFDKGHLLAGPPLETALVSKPPEKTSEPKETKPNPVESKVTAMPGLAVDGEGRVWLRFRHQVKVQDEQKRVRQFWTQNVTHLTSSGWAPGPALPGSGGRISVFSRHLAAADGGLFVAYSCDRRTPNAPHQPIHDRALVAVVERPAAAPGCPPLSEYVAPDAPQKMTPWDVGKENAAVTAARSHRVHLENQELRIVRGDLHRHTEMSWDVGPGNDGSYLDFYRYMIDVAQMDFGSLTDHQGGGHYAYHWWLTQKSADLYYLAPRFVPLYGYERSVKFPHGHRNIFHSYRGVPVFAFQTKLGGTGVFPGISSGDVVENDTKLLYRYLHGTRGVAISHTSATDSMGTDWRDNDPLIEPVVEIYQGARNSYEVVGGPRVHDIATKAAKDAPGGYQEAGLIWNALAKGYRLGTTSSSDHGSTHISYSAVYTAANDRESILAAIRQRHTYGSTDNIIVEAWANGHFMGDEFTTKERPALKLKVHGTATIIRVDLVRNNRYVYSAAPEKRVVEISFNDMDAQRGLNYYYFRVQQEDGEIAWASPLWVNVE